MIGCGIGLKARNVFIARACLKGTFWRAASAFLFPPTHIVLQLQLQLQLYVFPVAIRSSVCPMRYGRALDAVNEPVNLYPIIGQLYCSDNRIQQRMVPLRVLCNRRTKQYLDYVAANNPNF